MINLLEKFESLIILRTIMNNIDLNFIGTEDLDNIITTACELNIDLNCIDYDEIEYNDQYEEICDVFNDWYNDIKIMYEDVKNELNGKVIYK